VAYLTSMTGGQRGAPFATPAIPMSTEPRLSQSRERVIHFGQVKHRALVHGSARSSIAGG